MRSRQLRLSNRLSSPSLFRNPQPPSPSLKRLFKLRRRRQPLLCRLDRNLAIRLVLSSCLLNQAPNPLKRSAQRNFRVNPWNGSRNFPGVATPALLGIQEPILGLFLVAEPRCP